MLARYVMQGACHQWSWLQACSKLAACLPHSLQLEQLQATIYDYLLAERKNLKKLCVSLRKLALPSYLCKLSQGWCKQMIARARPFLSCTLTGTSCDACKLTACLQVGTNANICNLMQSHLRTACDGPIMLQSPVRTYGHSTYLHLS